MTQPNPTGPDVTDDPVPPLAVRAMVARIVLATELPMPVRIAFQGEGVGEPGRSILALSLRSVAQGAVWSRHLGGRTNTHVSNDRVWLDEGPIRWHGWSVHLQASDDLDSRPDLDPATATALTAIADDHTPPHATGGTP
jgi:hypothetical protein